MCRPIGGASRLRLLPPLLHLVTRSINFSPVFFYATFLLPYASYGISVLLKAQSLFYPPAVFPLKPALCTSSHIPLRTLSSVAHLKHLFLSPLHFPARLPNFIWPLISFTFLPFPFKVPVFSCYLCTTIHGAISKKTNTIISSNV